MSLSPEVVFSAGALGLWTYHMYLCGCHAKEVSATSTSVQQLQNEKKNKPKFSAQERKEFRKQKRSQNRVLSVPVDNPNPKFDDIKKSTLKGLCFQGDDEKDKSRAGNLDEAIIPFVEVVNGKQDFYTTSSCAGRSIVFEKMPDEKYQVEWVYLTHEVDCERKIMKENINTAIEKMDKGELWFKMEPPIVSIHCRNVQAASKMLDLAKGGGLKNCGIRSISRVDGSVMLTLVDTYHIEALLAVDGKPLVVDEYLDALADKAKDKLTLSRQRFEKIRIEFLNKL